MNYNVKPKLDGAGSTLPKVNAKAAPTNSAKPEEKDIFIEIGPPGTTNAGESTVSSSGLALYTFKGSPSIPDQTSKTCIGWCSDDIYAKWPGSTGWEKLANCSNIGDFGKLTVENKIYCKYHTYAPVIEYGDYNVVYFRNVAMTHVATEDYNNGQYPYNVISPSQACIDENNGKKWAVLRLAGSTSGSSQVPIFHLLVREVQKIINGKGYIPNNGCVIVGSFIGSSVPDDNGIYKDYTIIADEMAKCTVFVCGESAATILDFIELEKCNSYFGTGGGTKISQHICGYGESTEFVTTTTSDDNNDYFPFIPGMMQNPWPNQQKTCESGFFVAFTGYNTTSWGLGKAAIDLAAGPDYATRTYLCSYKTIVAKDVTINDLSDEVISAYNPATSGGLWARYFCGSVGIWGEVKAKGLMCGQDETVKGKVIPSEENLGRVGVYVDDTGNIIAVRSGIVLGNEADAQYQYATWNDIIKSRTHEDWINEQHGSGTPEHTYYMCGSIGGTYCVLFGYKGDAAMTTEFYGCMNYTRKMQFGEFGWVCGEGYCDLPAIATVKTIFICTGDDGFTVEDASKCSIDTVILYSGGDRSVKAPILPANVSICSTMTSNTQIAVTLNLDGIFNRVGDTYTPGQSANFTIPIYIEQDTQDEYDGIYYPDPTKKGTPTRWIPFQTTSCKLGFIGS